MRTRLVGIHTVRKRMADGCVKEYHYAWRGGPRIDAQPHTRAFVAEYVRLTRMRAEAPYSGSMAELVRAYLASPEFAKLKPATASEYRRYIDEIEASFFDLPLAGIDERGSRAVFLAWRDGMASKPRAADLKFGVLRRLLSFAVDREMIARNPILGVKDIGRGSRKDAIWSDEQIARFKASAPDYLARAMMLALWTGQRQADLLKLTWTAYDGTHIKLRQSKGGRSVRVRVHQELKAVLDSTQRTAVTILTNGSGVPWATGFRSAWRKACARAGVFGVTFHDLRGTFITAAHMAGASIREISEVSGHTEKEAERIIRLHYLAGDSAIERLEIVNRAGKGKPPLVK